jgi:hypothetical protein
MNTLEILGIIGLIVASIPFHAIDDDWLDEWTPTRIANAIAVCAILACLVLVVILIVRSQ